MVFDSVKNARAYYGLGKGIEEALKILEGSMKGAFVPGKCSVDGDRLYTVSAAYTTNDHTGIALEAHRRYIDVMMVLQGEEQFYFKPVEKLQRITQPYDGEKDALLAAIDQDCAKVRFPAGYFTVFFPQDAHCANQTYAAPTDVKKVIVKVRADLWIGSQDEE